MPVDTGAQPAPLRGREGEGGGVHCRPGEVTTMQAPLAEPDAGAIPDQEFEPVLAPVAKGVGRAVARAATEGVLYPLGESINAGTHVDRFDHQPDLGRCRDHGSCRNNSTSQGVLPAGNSMRQPLGLWICTTLAVTAKSTLTGTNSISS